MQIEHQLTRSCVCIWNLGGEGAQASPLLCSSLALQRADENCTQPHTTDSQSMQLTAPPYVLRCNVKWLRGWFRM